MTLCSILAVVALVASGCFMFEPSTYENRSTEDGNVWYVLAMWRRAPSKTQALKEVAMATCGGNSLKPGGSNVVRVVRSRDSI